MKEYGQPFLSKLVSSRIERLQSVNFKWEDKSYEQLMKEYPNSKAGIDWWCNNNKVIFQQKNIDENDNVSAFDINRNLYLKEFLIENPPTFKISSQCCEWSKKKVSYKLVKEVDCDLMIVGVRKAEGGIRSQSYKNCYTINEDTTDYYRPLFWFLQEDKEYYENYFSIIHSKCYTEYGFPRTGCVCCPYGNKHLYNELNKTRIYEPNLYIAANNIFKDSYEYTKKYRAFVREMKDKKKGRMKLF